MILRDTGVPTVDIQSIMEQQRTAQMTPSRVEQFLRLMREGRGNSLMRQANLAGNKGVAQFGFNNGKFSGNVDIMGLINALSGKGNQGPHSLNQEVFRDIKPYMSYGEAREY